MLEPYALKGACTVLRGGGWGNPTSLPDPPRVAHAGRGGGTDQPPARHKGMSWRPSQSTTEWVACSRHRTDTGTLEFGGVVGQRCFAERDVAVDRRAIRPTALGSARERAGDRTGAF